MISELKNKNITIKVRSLGAELSSLRKNNNEYIWNGDPKFWSGQSPVLFPIIGNLVNGIARIEGKEYTLGNHGFARKTDFKLLEATEKKLVYSLKYNSTTLTMYPYKFDLQLTYTLNENSVNISYKVINLDDKNIYFQLGTHPSFNCPSSDNSSFSDYFLEFNKFETLKRNFCDSSNLLIENKEVSLLENSNKIELNHSMFYDGALLIRDIKSNSISLKNKNNLRTINISNENFPYLGIWQPKDAPFICIEPWYGLAESKNFKGEFKEKEMIIELKKDSTHLSSITLTV